MHPQQPQTLAHRVDRSGIRDLTNALADDAATAFRWADR